MPLYPDISRPKTFSIIHRGQRWSGDYGVDADGMLRVGSAYGSGVRKLGRYDAQAMAERMLREQVDAWRQRRASADLRP
jgi:hypothetical protein